MKILTDFVKCGEIFWCEFDKFLINCDYCSENFDSKSIAFDHFNEHFQKDKNDNEKKITQTVKIEIEENVDCVAELKPVLEDTTNIFDDDNDLPKQTTAIENNASQTFTSSIKNKCKTKERPYGKSHLKWGSHSSWYSQVTCDICGKTMLKQSLSRHTKIHDSSTFPCDICMKVFNTKFLLYGHRKIHFSKKIYDQQHNELIQPPSNRARDSLKWGSYSSRYSRISCDICEASMQKESFYRHIKSHINDITGHKYINFICDICNRSFCSGQSLKRHRDLHFTKKHCCDYCGCQFHDKTNLITHLRRHTGEKPYKCSFCEKCFAQSSTLKTHIRSHTGEKPYNCNICNQFYKTKGELSKHQNRKHFNIRNFKCNSCDRAFLTSQALCDHVRVHTGDRPYSCEICNKSFKRRKTYKQHAILHTGEKNYKCRHCDSLFAQGAGRRSHERSVHKDLEYLIIKEFDI